MGAVIVFYLMSGVILAAALCVVFSRQPVYSVLALLVAMFCLAVLFVMLQAPFVAALQILLYAGAVLVLFLFVIMLLNLAPEPARVRRNWWLRGAGLGVAALFCAQIIHVLNTFQEPLAGSPAPAAATVADVGRLLFTSYLFPFELTSFLILAAIIGAVTLARSQDTD